MDNIFTPSAIVTCKAHMSFMGPICHSLFIFLLTFLRPFSSLSFLISFLLKLTPHWSHVGAPHCSSTTSPHCLPMARRTHALSACTSQLVVRCANLLRRLMPPHRFRLWPLIVIVLPPPYCTAVTCTASPAPPPLFYARHLRPCPPLLIS